MIIHPARGRCLHPGSTQFVDVGKMRVSDRRGRPVRNVMWIDLVTRRAAIYKTSGAHLRIAVQGRSGHYAFAADVVTARGWTVHGPGRRKIKV